MNKTFYWFCTISLIAMILIVLNSLVGDAVFMIRYGFAKANTTTNKIIETSKDPIQVNTDGKEYIRFFGNKNEFALNVRANYSISGIVITTNTNFWFRDVMRNKFDEVCLIDFGMVWGDLAKDIKLLHKNWKFKSYKSIGMSRRLEWRSRPPHEQIWSKDYFNEHISHTHLIPANENVMGALLKVKEDDLVKLDGYLVDIYDAKTSQLIAKTSMTRKDRDVNSRGSGACENMYVTRIQLEDKIYE